MKISDLIVGKTNELFDFNTLLEGRLIALDAYDGKILFDTRNNGKDYISRFLDGEIIKIWSDVKLMKSTFGDYVVPVTKVYISHRSWLKDE
jgi:hypothetical protein